LSIASARQAFVNINANVLPVKKDKNLEFDSSNAINRFANLSARRTL